MTTNRFCRARAGNAGVEFALILPLLMVLLFGGIEIGRALHDFHVVNESVRDAARYLGRAPYNCAGPGTGTCTTCDATGECGVCDFENVDSDGNGVNDYIQNAKALAMTGDTSGGANLLAGWTDPNSVTIEMCTIENLQTGVDADGNPIRPLAGLFDDKDAVPHVKLVADAPFTFLFGRLVAPNSSINITLSHNVVAAGL